MKCTGDVTRLLKHSLVADEIQRECLHEMHASSTPASLSVRSAMNAENVPASVGIVELDENHEPIENAEQHTECADGCFRWQHPDGKPVNLKPSSRCHKIVATPHL